MGGWQMDARCSSLIVSAGGGYVEATTILRVMAPRWTAGHLWISQEHHAWRWAEDERLRVC
jgi:hypothetical protein